MIAAFLLPFPLRGHRAPYLWVYYRLLSSFNERLLFIAGADYRRDPADWATLGRWELQEGSGQRLGYRIPAADRIAAQAYRDLDAALFAALLRQSAGNPVAVFRRLLSERIPALEEAFERILSEPAHAGLEAVLSWCNCPSLSAAAARCGIPVVHLEMGPLRWPDYRRPTAYLDFSGVNGHTEAAARYRAVDWAMTGIDRARLRAFFAGEASPCEPVPEFDVGLPLQVEDDSNLVAFGHGFDNQSLLIHALLDHPAERIVVRGHPGSLFGVRPGGYQVDNSPSSVAFIRRCRRIRTINSSVGFEAMLLGKPVAALGDASWRFIGDPDDPDEFLRRMAFYLFAYLVPMDLIYAPDYLRFRLARPAESAIVARHLAAYGVATNDADMLCGTRVQAALASP
jgi:hypothetical protein